MIHIKFAHCSIVKLHTGNSTKYEAINTIENPSTRKALLKDNATYCHALMNKKRYTFQWNWFPKIVIALIYTSSFLVYTVEKSIRFIDKRSFNISANVKNYKKMHIIFPICMCSNNRCSVGVSF